MGIFLAPPAPLKEASEATRGESPRSVNAILAGKLGSITSSTTRTEDAALLFESRGERFVADPLSRGGEGLPLHAAVRPMVSGNSKPHPRGDPPELQCAVHHRGDVGGDAGQGP